MLQSRRLILQSIVLLHAWKPAPESHIIRALPFEQAMRKLTIQGKEGTVSMQWECRSCISITVALIRPPLSLASIESIPLVDRSSGLVFIETFR